MKTKLSLTAFFLCSIMFIVLSCENDQIPASGKVFYDALSKTNFNLDDQASLNAIATTLAKETKEIVITQDASILDLKDSKGAFKAISVQYKVGENIVKMVVPLTEIPSDKEELSSAKGVKGNLYYVVDTEACEMKCTTVSPCTACTQEIIERCKSQTCSCTSGSTGCNASIIFND